MKVIQPNYAIYNNKSAGPIFGYGTNDLNIYQFVNLIKYQNKLNSKLI